MTEQEKPQPLNDLVADSIDEVIESLDRIIEWAKRHESRLGYFPAIYRNVTIAVKEKIENRDFDHPDFMEELDVHFANRYLYAFERYQDSQPITDSWKLAFETAGQWRPIVLQHLLLGMNAHIHLDLGISAAETAEAGRLRDVRDDFFMINRILSNQIDKVQTQLTEVWPTLKLLDKIGGNVDETLTDASLIITRERAWNITKELSNLPTAERSGRIKILDQETARMGEKIINHNKWVQFLLLLIRLTEIQSISRTIEILR